VALVPHGDTNTVSSVPNFKIQACTY
jgi:hypothetical protein